MARPFNSPFQVSTSNDAKVTYGVEFASTLATTTATTFELGLRTGPTAQTMETVDYWKDEIDLGGPGSLQLLRNVTVTVQGEIPKGWWVQIDVAASGAGTSATGVVEVEVLRPSIIPEDQVYFYPAAGHAHGGFAGPGDNPLNGTPVIDFRNNPLREVVAVEAKKFVNPLDGVKVKAHLSDVGNPGVALVPDDPLTVTIYEYGATDGAPLQIVEQTAMTDEGGNLYTHQVILPVGTYLLFIQGAVAGFAAVAGTTVVQVSDDAPQEDDAPTTRTQRFVREVGATPDVDVWEEVRVDRTADTGQKADQAATELLSEFAELLTIRAEVEGGPDAYLEGSTFTLDNHGKGYDGDWVIVNKEPVDGGERTVLTLNRVSRTFLDDGDDVAQRVGREERG